MVNWLQHVDNWQGCQRCSLGQQRTRVCLARSEWPADSDRPNLCLPCTVLFVGEAPGVSEDAHGLPFVGPAGKHLDRIIERSIPSEVSYVLTNLVLCFPREAKETSNHQPRPEEILACRPRLTEFINITRPRLIVCVGSLASEYVDHHNTIPCVDIVHPAAILRMPLAQHQMATQKCIVQIHNRLSDLLESPSTDYKEFTKGEEETNQVTRSLRTIYEEAEARRTSDRS